MRILVLALAILAFPLAAAAQPQLPPRVGVQQATPASVEDIATFAMLAAAESAQEDLRSLLEAMKAANARKKQLSRPSGSAIVVANPCAAADAASWRACVGRIQTKIAKAKIDGADKADLDRQVEALKSDLDSASAMGEMNSMRVSMAVDRTTKVMATLSEVAKKASDTSSGISQNIK